MSSQSTLKTRTFWMTLITTGEGTLHSVEARNYKYGVHTNRWSFQMVGTTQVIPSAPPCAYDDL